MHISRIHRVGRLNILLLFGGLGLGLLAAELALRLAGFAFLNITVPDEDRGFAQRPGAEGWYREEGESYIRINGDGLRDMGYARAKLADTFRIAVLGDSFTVAWEVPVEATFEAVMERALKGCPILAGKRVEAHNFGVSSYGTAQELLTLRYHVWDYDPDLVVLAVFTANDIHNNSRALEQDPLRPYFIFRGDELVLDESFLKSDQYRARQSAPARILYRIIDYSHVVQLLIKVNHLREVNRMHSEGRGQVNESLAAYKLGLVERYSYYEEPIYREPRDANWAEAWRVTEALIALMSTEVTQRGKEVLVVTLSNPIQVYPDGAVRREFMEALGVEDLFYPDRRISDLGKREGIDVLNLAPTLQAYADERQTFLHGFANTALGRGHWNAEAHRVAGQLMAQRVCEQLSGNTPR